MQVRHRFAHGEGGLVQVQLALEQHRQHRRPRTRPGSRAGVHHFGQAVAVVLVQLPDALVQAAEGLAVRGQHQRVGRQRLELVDRGQEQRSGSASGSTRRR
jgi:hypothetical protein